MSAQFSSVGELVILLPLMTAMASASARVSMLVTVSEQALHFHSTRKTSVMPALPAKFLFAGKACCLGSQTSLLSMAPVLAIYALQMAKFLISVWAWASVFEQEFARCDPRPCERRGSRRRRPSTA